MAPMAGNRQIFRTYLFSAAWGVELDIGVIAIPGANPGVDATPRRQDNACVLLFVGQANPRRPGRDQTGCWRSFMTAALLREFMPYGAPDLQDAERPNLVRAL